MKNSWQSLQTELQARQNLFHLFQATVHIKKQVAVDWYLSHPAIV